MAEAFGLLAPFYFVASALILVTLNNTRLQETQQCATPHSPHSNCKDTAATETNQPTKSFFLNFVIH